MTKVLLVINCIDNSGPGEVCVSLLRNSDKRIEYYVLSLKTAKIIVEAPNVHYLQSPNLSYLSQPFLLKKVIMSNVRGLGISVVHSHLLLAGLFNWSIPHLQTVHIFPGLQNISRYGYVKGKIINMFMLYSLRNPTILNASCSKALAYRLLSELSVDSKTVRNGIAPSLELSYSQPRIVPKIVVLSRLDKDKNIKMIIRFSTNHNQVVHFYGRGNEVAQLRLLEPYVKYHGFSSHPDVTLSQYDIFISASLDEGFPIAVLQALCVGCIVVLSDIAPHRELQSLFPQGVRLFNGLDDNALESCVGEILTNWNDYSVNRYERAMMAREVFSAQKMYQEYLKLYLCFQC